MKSQHSCFQIKYLLLPLRGKCDYHFNKQKRMHEYIENIILKVIYLKVSILRYRFSEVMNWTMLLTIIFKSYIYIFIYIYICACHLFYWDLNLSYWNKIFLNQWTWLIKTAPNNCGINHTIADHTYRFTVIEIIHICHTLTVVLKYYQIFVLICKHSMKSP